VAVAVEHGVDALVESVFDDPAVIRDAALPGGRIVAEEIIRRPAERVGP